jgi:hypothetical protein
VAVEVTCSVVVELEVIYLDQPLLVLALFTV